jgi:hypothetical protein
MTETEEQELKPMAFEDLTTDFIMSQEWRCNNPNYDGIFIDYPSVMLGYVTECRILTPNHHFKYPEVSQELCERICEEHNQNLHRAVPQWSQKPPTKDGWYWVKKKPLGSSYIIPEDIVYIIEEPNGKLLVLETGMEKTKTTALKQFCRSHHVWWLAIETPPLPGEEGAK